MYSAKFAFRLICIEYIIWISQFSNYHFIAKYNDLLFGGGTQVKILPPGKTGKILLLGKMRGKIFYFLVKFLLGSHPRLKFTRRVLDSNNSREREH